MIFARVIGGLGNQMFQYAAGRALSLRNGTELQLDTSGFESYALHHGFELMSVFEIEMLCLDGRAIEDLLGWRQHLWAQRMLSRLPNWRFGNPPIVNEPHFHYWPGWEDLPKHAYLAGYWQSERYFTDHAETIRRDFVFKRAMNPESEQVAERISASRSVSLHVRRGDYASNSQTTAVHGLCGLDYYVRAIDYMRRRVENMHLFIFSDDINWVRANLPLDQQSHTYVTHNNGSNSWQDMRLMSLCSHHVIANSSFSWWGAWLNPSDKKLVIAPRQWFAKQVNTNDLIPAEWIRL